MLYLVTGNTIYCKSIKAATIELYLKATAGLIQKLDPIPGWDAMKDEYNKKYVGIDRVLKEDHRIETVPDKIEAYTIAMCRELYQQQMLAPKNGLIRVLYNWFMVGLQGGFRHCECCQKDGAGLLNKIQMSEFGWAMAFILDNITFYTTEKIQLDLDTVRKNPELVAIVRVHFAWQKNLEHGIYCWFY